MTNRNFTQGHHAERVARVVLSIGIAIIAGCASVSSPAPEMVIYKSGLNQVYLEKDPDSASNAHPTTLSQGEVGALLRGVRVWKERNLIHELYAGQPERTRGFRNEEVKVLAPALSNALQLASPDQRVYFHLSHATDYGEEETTSGWLYVRGNLLHISLSEIHDRHSPGPDITKYDRVMPNVPEQAPAFHATFEPEEYLHTVRSGWRVFTVDQREELQIRYREALDALTKSPKS